MEHRAESVHEDLEGGDVFLLVHVLRDPDLELRNDAGRRNDDPEAEVHLARPAPLSRHSFAFCTTGAPGGGGRLTQQPVVLQPEMPRTIAMTEISKVKYQPMNILQRCGQSARGIQAPTWGLAPGLRTRGRRRSACS